MNSRSGLGVGGGDVDDAMRELAEAVESAVRGNRAGGFLGLDWSEDCPERE